MKVLQIDDSVQICKMYEDIFTSDHNTIESVNDGKKGLELTLANDYDLILLDMRMPKYNGMDFLKDLKKQKPSELKKIVVTTMLDLTETHEKKLMNFGIHSIEKKPLSFHQFNALEEKFSNIKEKKTPHLSILVIDDQTDTTSMLSKFFNFKGFQTTFTNDPFMGLKYIQQNHFDVILLDMNMPRLSGIQIISCLATEDILKNQNIFMFSANLNCDNHIKDLLRKDGINGCLKKPMDLKEILRAITKDLNIPKTT